MDACRVSLRMGAESVSCVYRRRGGNRPRRAEELEHAIEEGIDFHVAHQPGGNPGRFLGLGDGHALPEDDLGEPDASGRRRPVPVAGSEFLLDVDTVIYALAPRPTLSSRRPLRA